MYSFSGHSAKDVAKFFLFLSGRDCRPITPMQLLKLVFISHGWMLGLYGRPLIREHVEAWTYGPVVPSVYQDFKRYGSSPIPFVEEPPSCFDDKEKSIIEQVWGSYSKFTGIQLSSLTHKPDTPWSITRNSGETATISNDLIEQHYKTLAREG